MANRTLSFELFGEQMDVEIRSYIGGGNPAIQLWASDGPYMTASVNPPSKLQPGQVAIKNWSENLGIELQLKKAGIIGERVGSVTVGNMIAPVYQLLV